MTADPDDDLWYPGAMGTYTFREADQLTQRQLEQVDAIHNDPNNPLPVGLGDTESLFGYVHNESAAVVAWAWGSRTGSLGESHLIVLPEHQAMGLGSRLGLRYMIERNSAVQEFVFSVTNAVLAPGLLNAGFKPHPSGDGFMRVPFAGQALHQLRQQAEALGALAPTVKL